MLDYCQYIVLQIAPAYSVVQYHHSTKGASISNIICHYQFYYIGYYIIAQDKIPQLYAGYFIGILTIYWAIG
jgi:hypothetical protein